MRKEIEEQIKELKEVTALKDSLIKLEKNKDFQKVIFQSYFDKEPTRLTMIRPSIKTENLPHIDDAFKAVGLLKLFFDMVLNKGEQAETEIAKLTEELNNLDGEEI